MTTKSEHTREALMDAGEQLFAERGIDNVAVAEITERAGQKNGAAIHYHFGGRDGLLDAILERHHEQLDRIRLERLDEIRADGDVTVRALVEIIVEPMAGSLETESGRAFLKIQAHRAQVEGGAMVVPSESMRELRRELMPLLPATPESLGRERARLTTLMVNQRMGARADEEGQGRPSPSRAAVVSVLVDAVTSVLTAPVGSGDS